MNKRQFIESVFETAFGCDAIHRDFSYDEVAKELRKFSDLALKVEEP